MVTPTPPLVLKRDDHFNPFEEILCCVVALPLAFGCFLVVAVVHVGRHLRHGRDQPNQNFSVGTTSAEGSAIVSSTIPMFCVALTRSAEVP